MDDLETSETSRFSFFASTGEDIHTRYFRATVGREGRLMAIVGIVFFTALVAGVLFVWVGSSGKVPSMMRAWQEFRIVLIVPFIIVGYPWLVTRGLSLFVFDSEKAWNHRRGGQRIIEAGHEWASLPKEVWAADKERNHSKNAYYYDEHLGCMDRIPVDAELFTDRLVVKRKRKKDEIWHLKDAYKVFWGAGLLVLRFKTSYGPQDVVLDVSKMDKDELLKLQTFLYSCLPLWCRHYEKRFLKNPFRRERREFYKHSMYDRWDWRIPLLQPKGERVHFKTVSEMDEIEQVSL